MSDIERVREGSRGSVPITDSVMAKLQAWEEGGISRREMARRTGVSARRLAVVLGNREPRGDGANPRPAINVWAHRKPFRAAAQVARKLGYITKAGDTAGSGNVGLMLEAIGNGELVVLPADDVHVMENIPEDEWQRLMTVYGGS